MLISLLLVPLVLLLESAIAVRIARILLLLLFIRELSIAVVQNFATLVDHAACVLANFGTIELDGRTFTVSVDREPTCHERNARQHGDDDQISHLYDPYLILC